MRKTSSSLTRGFAARRRCFAGFPAIAGAMIPRRVFPSLGPDHDFPSLGISVNRPLYFTDDCLGTLLRNAQNPRRVVHGHWPAVVDSDRLPHLVIIRRTGCPSLGIWERARPGRARLQSGRTPTKILVIPNRAERPVRACPERRRRAAQAPAKRK